MLKNIITTTLTPKRRQQLRKEKEFEQQSKQLSRLNEQCGISLIQYLAHTYSPGTDMIKANPEKGNGDDWLQSWITVACLEFIIIDRETNQLKANLQVIAHSIIFFLVSAYTFMFVIYALPIFPLIFIYENLGLKCRFNSQV